MIDTRSQDPAVFKELSEEQRVRQKGRGQGREKSLKENRTKGQGRK